MLDLCPFLVTLFHAILGHASGVSVGQGSLPKYNTDASTDAVCISMISNMGTSHCVTTVREQAQGTFNLMKQE